MSRFGLCCSECWRRGPGVSCVPAGILSKVELYCSEGEKRDLGLSMLL